MPAVQFFFDLTLKVVWLIGREGNSNNSLYATYRVGNDLELEHSRKIFSARNLQAVPYSDSSHLNLYALLNRGPNTKNFNIRFFDESLTPKNYLRTKSKSTNQPSLQKTKLKVAFESVDQQKRYRFEKPVKCDKQLIFGWK